MSILAVSEDYLLELRKRGSNGGLLLPGEVDELKQKLDEAIHDFVGMAPEVGQWDRWLIYVLKGLELQAASLDPEHPRKFQAMLERVKVVFSDSAG